DTSTLIHVPECVSIFSSRDGPGGALTSHLGGSSFFSSCLASADWETNASRSATICMGADSKSGSAGNAGLQPGSVLLLPSLLEGERGRRRAGLEPGVPG